jgi:ribosomal protein S12 methylthiotransferase accessory factor
MLILKHAPKGYVLDTHRSKPPEETLKSAKKAASAAGITRVADITGLDRLGIPVFTSMRPRAEEGAITVYNGKGFTAQEAEVSAIMEGVERYSAEKGNYRIVTGSYAELKETSHGILDPATLIVPSARNYSYDEELEWAEGFSITRDTNMLVPAEAVFHPYHRTNQLFRTNTNGLAAGNVMEEAVFHALMELIERDAWSLFEVDASKCRDLEMSASDCGYQPVREIFSRLEAASVKAYIKDITSDVGIPTIAAAMDDEVTKDPALLSLGVGTHLVPEIAVLRALTEAAQSRLTTIHGTREDTFKAEYARRIGYDRLKRINKKWFAPSKERVRLTDLKSHASNDFLVDIEYTVKCLDSVDLREVIVVDLTRESVEIPAVRVLVPGLSLYALDKERTGFRLRTAIAGTVRKGQ